MPLLRHAPRARTERRRREHGAAIRPLDIGTNSRIEENQGTKGVPPALDASGSARELRARQEAGVDTT